MGNLVLFSDGGARGNPGPAAIGVYAELDGKPVYASSKYIGEATNNIAEYAAVLDGLRWLSAYLSSKDHGLDLREKILWNLDSRLVVEQLSGRFAVKKPHIRKLVDEALTIVRSLPTQIVFKHVPRERNVKADALVNKALDAKIV